METHEISLEEVKKKLLANGFSGLYFPGECGCGVDNLAPCGSCTREDGEEYINGCEPGHKHLDPRPGHKELGDFVVTSSATPPSGDEFDDFSDC